MARSRAYSGLTPPPLTCAPPPAGAPPAQLLADPVDLPRRVADLGRERVGVGAPGRRPDPAEQPYPGRQRAGDQDRRGPGGQGPAELLEGLVEAALDGVVGHAEAGRLGPAAVVPRHHGAADPPLGVAGELVDRARELAEIAADGVEQRPDRALVGLAADPPELLPDEVGPLAHPGQLGTADGGDARLGEVGDERLALDAARV